MKSLTSILSLLAVDVCQVGGTTSVVCAGTTSATLDPFWTQNAIQSNAPPTSGFFAVFSLEESRGGQ